MDRRRIRTRKAIREAYFDLIKEKKTIKISISEISRRADIDRKTFYLHFSSAEDVLYEYMDERVNFINDYLEEHNYFEDPYNVETLLNLIEAAQEQDMEFLMLISKSDAYDELWNKMQEILSELMISHERLLNRDTKYSAKIQADFLSTGIFGIYRRWLRKEYNNIDLQDLVEPVKKMISETAFS